MKIGFTKSTMFVIEMVRAALSEVGKKHPTFDGPWLQSDLEIHSGEGEDDTMKSFSLAINLRSGVWLYVDGSIYKFSRAYRNVEHDGPCEKEWIRGIVDIRKSCCTGIAAFEYEAKSGRAVLLGIKS